MEFNFKCNAFELYGADFLLSYDLKPWLIEINSSPALGATTAVTNRMCAAMLEDVVR
jgi:tubulin monoglycylase TTLL3/8